MAVASPQRRVKQTRLPQLRDLDAKGRFKPGRHQAPVTELPRLLPAQQNRVPSTIIQSITIVIASILDLSKGAQEGIGFPPEVLPPYSEPNTSVKGYRFQALPTGPLIAFAVACRLELAFLPGFPSTTTTRLLSLGYFLADYRFRTIPDLCASGFL